MRKLFNRLYFLSPVSNANVANIWLLLHLRPNYIHSASNDIHMDGPRARARARARG